MDASFEAKLRTTVHKQVLTLLFMRYFSFLFALVLSSCLITNNYDDGIKIPKFTGDVDSLMLNTIDKNDQVINLAMLDCARALNILSDRDSKFGSMLFEEISSSDLKEFELKTFLNKNEYLKKFNIAIKELGSDFDLDSKLVYAETDYFIQVTSVSENDRLKPIFGVGESINENDEIIAFMGENEYIVSDIVATSINMYIVSISTNKIVTVENTENSWSRNESSRGSKNYVAVWDNYKIKKGYRYERNGKSDLRFDITPYEISGCPGYPNNNSRIRNEFITKRAQRIAKIKKRDVNNSQVFLDDKDLIKLPVGFNSLGYNLYITAYEYDWYSSHKRIQGCVSASSCSLFNIHDVRMKYSNEWYYVNYCGFGFANSNVGDSFTVDNSKCTLTIKRTE